MTDREDLLRQFGEWSVFVQDMKELDWSKPVSEGKWAIHDVVGHIMMWDQYFWEEAISPITAGKPVTVKELDFDAFNRNAAAFGKTKTKEELIELALRYRSMIIDQIKSFDEERFSKEYGNFTVESYLRDFIWHDRHHMSQIQERREYLV
ncbi:DinB family protein [Paenibacillus macerans]|uniref:DinB family protein n=1 Tax=Paenibacillus macerans TaxID=44252 RepID=UPI003D320F39